MRLRRLLLALILSPAALLAGDRDRPPTTISYYYGAFSRTTLGEILLSQHTNYQGAYMHAVALSRPLPLDLWEIPLEGEAMIVHHSGWMKHMEFNGAVLARMHLNGTPLSLAAGEGLSLASRRPDVENPRRSWRNPYTVSEYGQNFLNLLLFEAEFRLPAEQYSPRVFLRVHHRSGAFGLLCPPTCGSNFIAYGFRFTL